MSLTYRGTDLQTGALHFDVTKGLNEPAVARGKDDTIPEAAGQEEGVWIADHRIIVLTGKVQGVGATELLRQQSWRAGSDTLRTLMDRAASPGVLVIGPPDHGVSATWRLNARCINYMEGPILNAWTLQKWSFELICIDSPPEWTTP